LFFSFHFDISIFFLIFKNLNNTTFFINQETINQKKKIFENQAESIKHGVKFEKFVYFLRYLTIFQCLKLCVNPILVTFKFVKSVSVLHFGFCSKLNNMFIK